MSPTEYILNCLQDSQMSPPALSFENLTDEIYRLLLSKKFRKYSVNPEYLIHIKKSIDQHVATHEPIKLTLVFGGYKLWRLTEAPEPDWAELFAFIYYAQWLRPICAIYEPGVLLDFFSDDVILDVMDNVPKEDTKTYGDGFKKLLAFIEPFIPKNLRLTYTRVGDQYESYESFLNELDRNKEMIENELHGLPVLTSEQQRLVELNVKLKANQTDDPKWKERVFLIHEAYSRLSKRRPYYRTPEKIFVITKQMKDSLAVGTTKNSIVKFWIGAGALEKNGDAFIQHIYSPHQLEVQKFERENVKIKGLTGKNFGSIRVLKNS